MTKEYLTETDIIPFHASPPPGEKVLILAPHPDDETFGCGGTIKILLDSGRKVKVVFLTSGDKADPSNSASLARDKDTGLTDYTVLREKEAKKALSVLGITDYVFLRYPDRELYENSEDLIDKLSQIIDDYEPDSVYCSSMVELNPDHRAAAASVLELQKKYDFRIVFYEVTVPVRVNTLVDITKVIKTKLKAVKFYRSQLKIINYLEINNSMNRFRSLTLDKKVRYAEGFFVLESVSEQAQISEWLNYIRPLQ